MSSPLLLPAPVQVALLPAPDAPAALRVMRWLGDHMPEVDEVWLDDWFECMRAARRTYDSMAVPLRPAQPVTLPPTMWQVEVQMGKTVYIKAVSLDGKVATLSCGHAQDIPSWQAWAWKPGHKGFRIACEKCAAGEPVPQHEPMGLPWRADIVAQARDLVFYGGRRATIKPAASKRKTSSFNMALATTKGL